MMWFTKLLEVLKRLPPPKGNGATKLAEKI
jgi:hypothetical protein